MISENAEFAIVFRAGDLDLPERRKRYEYTSSREEDAQMCPCGKAIESGTHIPGSGRM